MLHTTFRRAKEANACIWSYRKFAKFKGGVKKWGYDTPFPLSEVLEVCGLDDTLWALQIVIEPADKEIRLLACDYAKRVLPIFEKRFPEDKRPRQAIEASRKYAQGKISIEQLRVASDASWAVVWDVVQDAQAASDAAQVASWAVASAALDILDVSDIAQDARSAIWYAWAAWDAPRTALAAERKWQERRLLKLLNAA